MEFCRIAGCRIGFWVWGLGFRDCRIGRIVEGSHVQVTVMHGLRQTNIVAEACDVAIF